MTNITIGKPDENDSPPTEKELRTLQMYAGELNWLATRTRPDLAYYTSIIASTCTKYSAWTLELCTKVFRYLASTPDVGIVITRTGKESEFVVWTDAGYGGLGTKSQTGLVIWWGGVVLTWRSARQGTAALSTCEAEVTAAATGFQVAEGMRFLLQEWGIQLDPTILLIDNRSALLIGENGGTWRTRYFAVRSARIQQEHMGGNIILRYCPTKMMVADALTKMASTEVIKMLRDTMEGKGPGIPGNSENVSPEQNTWWAARVLAVPIETHQRRLNLWRDLKTRGRKVGFAIPSDWWKDLLNHTGDFTGNWNTTTTSEGAPVGGSV